MRFFYLEAMRKILCLINIVMKYQHGNDIYNINIKIKNKRFWKSIKCNNISKINYYFYFSPRGSEYIM